MAHHFAVGTSFHEFSYEAIENAFVVDCLNHIWKSENVVIGVFHFQKVFT